jgi:hypothetical protein
MGSDYSEITVDLEKLNSDGCSARYQSLFINTSTHLQFNHISIET